MSGLIVVLVLIIMMLMVMVKNCIARIKEDYKTTTDLLTALQLMEQTIDDQNKLICELRLGIEHE